MNKKPFLVLFIFNILIFLIISLTGSVGMIETANADNGGGQPPPLDTIPPIGNSVIEDNHNISLMDILLLTTSAIF